MIARDIPNAQSSDTVQMMFSRRELKVAERSGSYANDFGLLFPALEFSKGHTSYLHE
jgi:hypothetical protein